MKEFKARILSERYPDIQVSITPENEVANVMNRTIGNHIISECNIYTFQYSFDLFCGKRFESEEEIIDCSRYGVEKIIKSKVAEAEQRKSKFKQRFLKALETLELEKPLTKYAVVNDCIGTNSKTGQKEYGVFSIKTNDPMKFEGRVIEIELWLNKEERERRIKLKEKEDERNNI